MFGQNAGYWFALACAYEDFRAQMAAAGLIGASRRDFLDSRMPVRIRPQDLVYLIVKGAPVDLIVQPAQALNGRTGGGR